ncbi:PadR family transcriptional regulator [Rhodopila sp.]|uniref:PadR family transcriptional regulator n=1 Tax=Rhodopila sp. TaxID=2480087 RepID=UPI003D152FD4
MIATRAAHGYDLIKALEDRMGGGYSPSPGVIYPTLTMLQEQGLASVATADGKKLYTGNRSWQRRSSTHEPGRGRRHPGAHRRHRQTAQPGTRPTDHPGGREPEDRSAAAPGRQRDPRPAGSGNRGGDRCGGGSGGAVLAHCRRSSSLPPDRPRQASPVGELEPTPEVHANVAHLGNGFPLV